MALKETFIENLSRITAGMKQKEIAKIMGCTEGTMSKYLNQSKKDFPTVEMLYNLAQHFGVSIDWIVGNSSALRSSAKISPRDICKILVNLYTSQKEIGFTFGNLSVTEDCYDPICADGYITCETHYEKKQNTYIAAYFSERDKVETDDDAMNYFQLGNKAEIPSSINEFLYRFVKISEMLKEGNLTQEMYDRLLESYLNDVPD